MKKLLLGLGTIAAVAAPVVAVVSCSSQMDDAIKKLKDGYKDDIIKYGASLTDEERAQLLDAVNALKGATDNIALKHGAAMTKVQDAKDADKAAKGAGVVQPTKNASGEQVIALTKGMSRADFDAAVAVWDNAEKEWSGHEHDADFGSAVLKRLPTFVFQLDGEEEKINLSQKVAQMKTNLGKDAVYTPFEDKVNALAASVGRNKVIDF